MKNLNEQLGCQVTRKEDRHAGLENGHLNLLTFNDAEMLRWILTTIGFTVDDTGIVNDKKGVPVKCSGCECKLTLDEIAYVMPPSYFYCCNPICIYDYFERYGYPDHTHTIRLEHPDYIKEHLEELMIDSEDEVD